MNKYKFNARNNRGEKVTGTVEALNPKIAINSIRERGLLVVKLTPEAHGFLTDFQNKLFNKISIHDLTAFTRQLSTMTTAGLQLTNSLSILRAQSKPGMASILGGCLADIQGGSSLSAALSKYPEVFSKSYISLIKSGEAAGVLEKVLARLADNLEKQEEFQSKVKGAMIYPVIVVLAMVVVTFIMMIFVVPQMATIYKDFGAELPLPTQLLIGISNIFVNFWWIMILLMAVGVLGFSKYSKTPMGQRKIDDIKLKLPVFGKLTRLVILTEFTRTLSLMIGTGISVIEALNIVAESSGNALYEASMKNLAKQVEKGFPMAFVMANEPLYPPIVSQMISVGEETGKVDEVLIKLSRYFEVESDQMVKGLTTAIEPMVLVFLGVGIGFIVIAIIMPIYNLAGQI